MACAFCRWRLPGASYFDDVAVQNPSWSWELLRFYQHRWKHHCMERQGVRFYQIIHWTHLVVQDLSHEKSIRGGSCWITAAAFMPLTRKLCTTDFSRAVKIYDCPSFHPVGSIQDIPYAPLCLTCWKTSKRRDVDFVCMGDVAGNARTLEKLP